MAPHLSLCWLCSLIFSVTRATAKLYTVGIEDQTFPDILIASGFVPAPGVWRGTAPWCAGDCQPGEVQVGSASNGATAVPSSGFGKGCLIGNKRLCSPQYSTCTSVTTAIQIVCQSVEGLELQVAAYSNCRVRDLAAACSIGGSQPALVVTTVDESEPYSSLSMHWFCEMWRGKAIIAPRAVTLQL
ncbi:hypothetical protein CALCODRAFT_558676 [Calocera cornea HHB12733]|uniref:SRCR domain-containing protein n=1 Tax=Calocera cornea HHB12733 TaxID=1353952 RepID=A0A165CSI8_9BASI|nr:hypothetical protein CALCODRAFT_558676 [Calocera cornea HHB12733]